VKGAPLTPAPAAPETPLREALAAYLADNGFTARAYEENFAKLGFFGLPVWIPNTKGRKRGLPLHDLHHVALGFGTDLVGECRSLYAAGVRAEDVLPLTVGELRAMLGVAPR
jgi:hypothetical protein